VKAKIFVYNFIQILFYLDPIEISCCAAPTQILSANQWFKQEH